MRATVAAIITLVIMTPSFLQLLAGRVDSDDFGLRFFFAALFAIFATGAASLFVRVTAAAEPQPQRRKTDQAEPQPE